MSMLPTLHRPVPSVPGRIAQIGVLIGRADNHAMPGKEPAVGIGRPIGVYRRGEECLDRVKCRLARAVEFLAFDNPRARDKLGLGLGVRIQVKIAADPFVTNGKPRRQTRFADTLTAFQDQHGVELDAGLLDPAVRRRSNRAPNSRLSSVSSASQ